MTKKIKIADLPEFDMAEHLPDGQAIAEYLTVVLEEDDPAALADALGTIARSRGMSDIAKASGITREAPLQGTAPECQPSLRDHQQGLRGARCPPGGPADSRTPVDGSARLRCECCPALTEGFPSPGSFPGASEAFLVDALPGETIVHRYALPSAAIIAGKPLKLLVFAAFFIDGTADGISERQDRKTPIKSTFCACKLQCAKVPMTGNIRQFLAVSGGLDEL